MDRVAVTRDPQWTSAAELLSGSPVPGRPLAALIGLCTYATSITARSARNTPSAIREALARYSTWSYSDHVDLAEEISLVDCGDVADPDGPDGFERVVAVFDAIDPAAVLRVVLGGDNAATHHAMRALAGPALAEWGLITFDAHLDVRDGVSNGSPVRQLLEAGLAGEHVVQLGVADFANSAPYARRARDAGVTVISRDTLRSQSLEEMVARALDIAGGRGRAVYVDVDLDVADRAVVPGCPAAAPGGLSADELRRMVRAVTSDPRVRAIDFTEIDVARDAPDERTVRLAALLVLEALAGVRRRSL